MFTIRTSIYDSDNKLSGEAMAQTNDCGKEDVERAALQALNAAIQAVGFYGTDGPLVIGNDGKLERMEQHD